MATAPIVTSFQITLDWETTRGWSVERIVVPMSSLPGSCGGHHHPNPSSTTSQTTVSTVLLATNTGTQKFQRIYWRLCVPLSYNKSLWVLILRLVPLLLFCNYILYLLNLICDWLNPSLTNFPFFVITLTWAIITTSECKYRKCVLRLFIKRNTFFSTSKAESSGEQKEMHREARIVMFIWTWPQPRLRYST